VYPHLSLDRINIDENVARRLPRRLAYYHLALPIAEDDDSVSVAMAYPDNGIVIQLIESVLNSAITPVYSAAEQIRERLNHVWGVESAEPLPRILAWSDSAERREWTRAYAEQFAPLLTAGVEYRDDVADADLALLLESGSYNLMVCSPSDATLPALLRHKARSSLLLVRGAYQPLLNVLVVLRGHAPDEDVLNRIVPLAVLHQARVTVLTVAPAGNGSGRRNLMANHFAALLSQDTQQGFHLAACMQRLNRAGIAGQMRVRQGVPEAEIADEIARNRYSLIAIAAEAHGDFVFRVLSAIQQKQPDSTSAILVVKP
jgi:nucleotide-binding universal stress UspA family protein